MGRACDEVVYFDGSAARTLRSRTKIAVMEELESGSTGFGELVERVDRAKSTVSNHLSDLERMGLVEVEPDAEDRRKRVVRTESRRVGSTGEGMELEGPLRDQVSSSLGDAESFLKSIIVVLRYHAYTTGLNLNPALKEAGGLIGEQLGEEYDGEREGFLDWLSTRWEDLGLGQMEADHPEIRFKGDIGCEEVPGPGVCGFYEGFLEGAIKAGLGGAGEVSMRRCGAYGAEYCRFEVA